MAIVEELIENVVERNAFDLNGALTITLVEGGIKISGRVLSTLRDQRKNKNLLNIDIPVDADVKVGDIVIPLPPIP